MGPAFNFNLLCVELSFICKSGGMYRYIAELPVKLGGFIGTRPCTGKGFYTENTTRHCSGRIAQAIAQSAYWCQYCSWWLSWLLWTALHFWWQRLSSRIPKLLLPFKGSLPFCLELYGYIYLPRSCYLVNYYRMVVVRGFGITGPIFAGWDSACCEDESRGRWRQEDTGLQASLLQETAKNIAARKVT